MTPEQKLAFEKRRRGRNWALLAALLGLVVLFYFIAAVRLMGG
ncbi:hypothetical protein ACVFYP_01960 [Roseomonas sp. F4]